MMAPACLLLGHAMLAQMPVPGPVFLDAMLFFVLRRAGLACVTPTLGSDLPVRHCAHVSIAWARWACSSAPASILVPVGRQLACLGVIGLFRVSSNVGARRKMDASAFLPVCSLRATPVDFRLVQLGSPVQCEERYCKMQKVEVMRT